MNFKLDLVKTSAYLSLERGLGLVEPRHDAFRIIAILSNRQLSQAFFLKNGLLCQSDDLEQKLSLTLFQEGRIQLQKTVSLDRGQIILELTPDSEAIVPIEINCRVFNPEQQSNRSSLLRLPTLGLGHDLRLISGDLCSNSSYLPGPFAGKLLIPWEKTRATGKPSIFNRHPGSPPSLMDIMVCKFYEYWLLMGAPSLINISHTSDRMACMAVVAAITLQDHDVHVTFGSNQLPSSWRRLAQNLRLRQKSQIDYDVGSTVDLADFFALFEANEIALKKQISAIGIVPQSLWES